MAMKLVVVRHVPHSPTTLMFFDSGAEALRYEDPDGGTFEWWFGDDGVRHVIGTWLDCVPGSAVFVDNAEALRSAEEGRLDPIGVRTDREAEGVRMLCEVIRLSGADGRALGAAVARWRGEGVDDGALLWLLVAILDRFKGTGVWEL